MQLSLSLNAQSANEDVPAPGIVTGHPFSAVKYIRTVRVQPDGRRAVTSESHHILMARDTDGRISMAGAGADNAGHPCDLPPTGKLPLCDHWLTTVFDPKAGIMWHWMDGEVGDKEQLTRMDLLADQLAEAKRLTSALPIPHADTPEPGVSVQELGERNFSGISAQGIRTTTTHSGADGKPAITIHEVWTSVKMRLVLRVVDGDPLGEETVSGLSHLSLTPDPKLFQLPHQRILRHWKDSDQYATGDITNFSEWIVK